MERPHLHRFMSDGKRYALDPDTCFCFECDAASWDVLEHYPFLPVNRIYHLLEERHPRKDLEEVVGELEWLRASRSILQTPRQEDFQKRYEIEPGLCMVRVNWTPPGATSVQSSPKGGWWKRSSASQANPSENESCSVVGQAAKLLFARSGRQRELRLEVVLSPGTDPQPLVRSLDEAMRQAQTSGKRLTVALGYDELPLSGLPEALGGHAMGAWFETSSDKSAPMEDLARVAAKRMDKLERIAAAFNAGGDAITGRIVLRPGHAKFEGAVCALETAGFIRIDLDTDGAFAMVPGLDPAAVMDSLRANAAYYAGRLLKNHYYRVEPFATLFLRIFHGTPMFRTDPAGLHALTVDASGGVWPGRHFVGREGFHLGVMGGGSPLNEAALRRFEDVGALTTAACIPCWARGLCGGGTTAVHQAFLGSFRTPHKPWCDAQRAWMEGAVAAFNTLSSAGIDFTRVYESLGRTGRPSLWMMAKMAKTALQLRVLMRPIEEADAELLTRWENWNEAAYFTYHESGLLLATRYDREMDALHPRAYEQEFMITDRGGASMGLIKIRPDRLAGLASAWLYLRKEEDYANDGVRSALRMLLREALKGRGIKRVIAPAGPKEDALAACFQAIGFQAAGTARAALYLHGQYHDVRLFVCEAEAE